MAERHRERIGRVIGPGNILKAEQHAHHLLHLALVGTAIAGYCLLYLGGCVLVDRHSGLRGCQHHHTARLPDRQRGRHIPREEELLNDHGIRVVRLNQTAHPSV